MGIWFWRFLREGNKNEIGCVFLQRRSNKGESDIILIKVNLMDLSCCPCITLFSVLLFFSVVIAITFFVLVGNSYRDILHHNKKPFYLKGQEEDSSTLDAYIMHSLNHIFRTRDLVKKNEAKLAKLQENVKANVLNNESFLDRGFTRPKVLILLPLASVAFRVVKRLIDLTPPKYKSNVEEHERFYREFGAGVSEDKEDEDATEIPELKRTSKPSDFQALFGGNNNDHFMIGIKFTRRSIKLYGDFYSSDMIVASPLGLITKIGEAELYKDKNVDYLSSIEVIFVGKVIVVWNVV
ncbi:protein NUCLEOLAR FACTOR 1-like, partial [Lycium barbarum]|uniref:protein NUCLEOLAR FACTOR 1-like n=1 Tax=Lycium barbarum TaxID=112863 RepID=UPI00293EF7A5